MDPVRKAIWFVESHLREPLTLDAIASACHVSPFHLTRAFATVTGRPLMRYVRGRRLSEAARRLTEGAEEIQFLALRSGYGSHEAFTRAFREQFEQTPEQIRSHGRLETLPLVEALPMNSPMTENVDLEEPRFEQSKPLRLLGLAERYPCQNKAGIPNQWQRFSQMHSLIAGQIDAFTYGVIFHSDSDPDPENHFEYLCAVEVNASAAVPSGMTELNIPSHKHVVFSHKGHVAKISSIFAAIWSQWFPQSGYTAAKGPMYVRNSPEFNGRTGMGGFEIWIPVEA